jgi:cytidylate kinase
LTCFGRSFFYGAEGDVPIITISRQYGSLGDEIGKEVAHRLGLRLVDNEIIGEVAKRLGVPPSRVSAQDERTGSFVSELVDTMRLLYPATLHSPPSEHEEDLNEGAYLQVIREVIWEVARSGNAVILGRGAAFITPRHPDVLHVLMIAPLETRIARVMAAEGLNHEEAARRIKQVDTDRARYVRHFYHTNWLDPGHYDLVVNTGYFTQARATSLVCAAAAPEQTPTQEPSTQL